MNPIVTPEHEALRETIRKFAEKEIAPVAQELDDKEQFSPELTKKMGEQGLFGMVVPEEYGGFGLDYLSYVIAVEELARVDGSQAATVAAHNSLGIGPLYYFGTEAQKKKYIPKLCTGEHVWAFGLTEPNAGSDAGGSKTTAKLVGDEWVINGSKIFITNGSADISTGVTVQAVTGEKAGSPRCSSGEAGGKKEYSCIIVEKGTKGFTAKTMKKKMLWRSSDTAELYFDNCRVPKENLLGTAGKGFAQMLQTLDSGRLSIAAMGLGCAQGAFDKTLKYAKQREQFGQPIAHFQANAFKLADMATEIEAARHLLYHACWLRDNKKPFAKEAAMSKLYCSEVAGRVVDHAVQIHGGYGLMKEYDVERFYRDQKLLTIGEGTSEIQRLVIARQIGCFDK